MKHLSFIAFVLLSGFFLQTAHADGDFCQIPQGYERLAWITPDTIEGDLDMDGVEDKATLVHEIKTRKKGIVLCSSRAKRVFIFGAGREFGNGGDNFDWMNVWEFRPRSEQLSRIEPENRLSRQNLLYVGVAGGPGGRIYFEGGGFKWEQFGE